MKKGSTIFLQLVVVLVGIGALAILLVEPHFEGRNAHATLTQIYFGDPFLAYVYAASFPFFIALYQAYALLGYAGRDAVLTQRSVDALRTIKHCAIALVACVAGAEAYLWISLRGTDDIAGEVAMGVILMFISAVIATAAAVFERTLQGAVDIKAENDFTV